MTTNMAIFVCTLYENNYHYGLAALVNSLYKKGYTGEVYVGYKGELPPWSAATENLEIGWLNASTFKVNNDLSLVFLPIDSNTHMANYKPAFILSLFKIINRDIEGLIYFDPDIVIKCNWEFYKTWIKYGVSLVHEVISTDMPLSHPIRKGWVEIVELSGRKVTHNINSYINSGFCGVRKQNIEFLEVWNDIMRIASERYDFKLNEFIFGHDRSDLFFAKDQDAFNIAAMCCESPISEMGPEGMDFINGGFTMSHAVGHPKPWAKNYLLSAINGNAPSKADREFWNNVNHPIQCYVSSQATFKKMCISTAAFIGRFYRRS